MFDELGPKAKVLTMRYVKQRGWRAWFLADRVEVTASIEKVDLERYTEGKLDSSLRTEIPEKEKGKKKQESAVNLNDNLAQLKESIRQDVDLSGIEEEKESTYGDPRLKDSEKPKPLPKKPKESDQDRARRKLAALRAVPQGGKKEGSTKVEKEEVSRLDQLRKVIREELSVSQKEQHVQHHPTEMEKPGKDTRFLLSKGVDLAIAKKLEQLVEEGLQGHIFASEKEERTYRLNRMMRAIAAMLQTAGPLHIPVQADPEIVAIVGPTGVGKTTTLAKIASWYACRGHRVSVISIDTVKIGAREQIRALAHKFDLDLQMVSDASGLRAAVAAHQDADLILIDTAGQCQYRSENIKQLSEVLGSVKGIKNLLALSATTKDIDSYGTVEQFFSMKIDSIIVTKLDETIAHGLLVNLCQKTKLPLRYLTNGQCIEQDLQIADALSIARSLLLENNERRFDRLRKMATVS